LTRSLVQLEAAARTGSTDAQVAAGVAHARGGDPVAALRWFEQAAAAGHPTALYECARWWWFGFVGDPQRERAEVALDRALELGVPAALEFALTIHLGGRRHPECQRWHAESLRLGAPAALLSEALRLGRQPGTESRVREHLKQAAERGHASAALLLAAKLRAGEGGPVDITGAVRLDAQLSAYGQPPLPMVGACPINEPDSPFGATATARSTTIDSSIDLRSLDRLLSADECRLLIASARPHLRPSGVFDERSGDALKRQPIRTSAHATFDPVLETSALKAIQLRLAAAADVPLDHCEYLAVLHYAPGQQYRPHLDALPPGGLDRDRPSAGNRLRTLITYLNTPDRGGDTVFPRVDQRVTARAGSAVRFDNLDADGRPLAASLHAGEPVESGEKWVASLWVRERDYRGAE
jgi:prolyl 4-hydroxylase